MNTEVTLRNLPLSEDLIVFARRRAEGVRTCEASEVRVTLAGNDRPEGARRVVASIEVAPPTGPGRIFTAAGPDPYAALERALRHVAPRPRPQVAA